jgi:hypothetical protein
MAMQYNKSTPIAAKVGALCQEDEQEEERTQSRQPQKNCKCISQSLVTEGEPQRAHGNAQRRLIYLDQGGRWVYDVPDFSEKGTRALSQRCNQFKESTHRVYEGRAEPLAASQFICVRDTGIEM